MDGRGRRSELTVLVEAEATKRRPGRPEGIDPRPYLNLLRTLRPGPCTFGEILERAGFKQKRTTAWRYLKLIPDAITKTDDKPSRYYLTLVGEIMSDRLEGITRLTRGDIKALEAEFSSPFRTLSPLFGYIQDLEFAVEYLRDNKPITQDMPKFREILGFPEQARAITAWKEKRFCYPCMAYGVLDVPNDEFIKGRRGFRSFAAGNVPGSYVCPKCGRFLNEEG